MKEGSNETPMYIGAEAAAKAGLEEAKPILQLERQLLQIDKYAAREGLSTKLVEKCGQLGIVQIRKYKGNTYVVDVPLSPYYPASEGTPVVPAASSCPLPPRRFALPNEAASVDAGVGDENRRGKQESHKMTTQSHTKPRSTSGQPINKTIRIAQKSGLAYSAVAAAKAGTRKAAPATHKIEGQPARSKIEHPKAETIPTLTKHETEQTQAKHAWQGLAVSLIVCFCVAFLTVLWLYMNQRVHRSRLDQASASIRNVYDDSVQTGQQLASFQSSLIESTAEIELIKNELDNTKAGAKSVQEDIESLRHEITKLRQGLETIQQQNTGTLEQLKEQFQQLTAQLSEFTKKNQAVPDYRGSGK